MSYVNSDLTDPFWRSKRISELEREVERLEGMLDGAENRNGALSYRLKLLGESDE